MHLINTYNYTLEEFISEDGLKYAILSHRWEDGEVNHQEMLSGAGRSKKGFDKIRRCCDQARRDGIDYAWVDTCCIDKKSSAELSEAINSMYRWYKNSTVCYAFLSDVQTERITEPFPASKWLTRGWTLQELLAPKNVVFFNKKWQRIGTKAGHFKAIADITNIGQGILSGIKSIHEYSIAQRMSWASGRTTTRPEDRAYSLMGLFDVNMPMLYGEGEKAFLRLQEEIIRRSYDHSIFAWKMTEENVTGMLAKSPAAFADGSPFHPFWLREAGYPYSLTNRGLSIKLKIRPWAADVYLAVLNCARDSRENLRLDSSDNIIGVGIFLCNSLEEDRYMRVKLDGKSYEIINYSHAVREPTRSILINVGHNIEWFSPAHDIFETIYGYRICCPEILERADSDDRLKIKSCRSWDSKTGLLLMGKGDYGNTAVIELGTLDQDVEAIVLGFGFDFSPIMCITDSTGPKADSLSTLDRDDAHSHRWPKDPGRSCFDKLYIPQWSKTRLNPAKRVRGVCCLKGDRLNGLDIELPVWPPDAKDTSRPRLHVQIKQAVFQGKEVWEVHISGWVPVVKRNVSPSPPRRRR
ncbi:heterokaryon incompatibility protein-domain-containing protein [Biscogniauxia sp. FL1348]|nr:heterokaryon incompatibility protein-domain-containing protein [Biscogniauxia sp. FL1348]